jgi:hypothetical protein
MHQSLINIQQELEKVIASLKSAVPSDEPLGNAHGNWSFPGLTRSELVADAQEIIESIKDQGTDQVGEQEAKINDYVRRLQHLYQQTIPNLWQNANHAVAAYLFTLDGLRKALSPILTRDGRAEASANVRRLTQQIRGLQARLDGLEPRADSITTMVDSIERAYNAADQLPTDLESLAEAKKKVDDTVQEATKDQSRLLVIREQAEELDKQLGQIADEAKAVLKNCESAYSAATSVGLAAAFTERSSKLSISMWVWVIGLIGSLVAGSYFGVGRLQTLVELFRDPNPPLSIIIPNMILSVLSIGAPIWFAWLSTKQIGQRFRLSEDYAYKASIARAYEGFRREAARVDKNMEARLLASALSRLDELPLRLVEVEAHGSPWHELANSDVVKQAFNLAPNFAAQVKELAQTAINKIPIKTAPVKTAKAAESASVE